MDLLNKIIGYWLDCIKHEDVLAQKIPVYPRTTVTLCSFTYDPFIFNRKEDKIHINDKKTEVVLDRSCTTNKEIYYGYPLFYYFDHKNQTNHLAPLFVVKLSFSKDKQGIFLQKENSIPNCGIQALNKIGLRTEEIDGISKKFEKIFKGDISDPQVIVKKCLEIILEETNFSINEDINPKILTNNQQFYGNTQIGLYNKSIIFSDESTIFNMSLIRDLIDLKSKSDIKYSALSFIKDGNIKNDIKFNKSLVLPFPLNDYQISALKGVFENKLSVITGPPGTGKSQFIMNLVINLFLNNKTVLFVSHTGEAVNVVNDKMNKYFRNLLLRTGNKELRERLTEKFSELSLDAQKNYTTSVSLKRVDLLWNKIINLKKTILKIDELEEKVTELIECQKLKKSIIAFLKLKFFLWRLKRLPLKINIEKEIKRIEKDFFQLSKDYVKDIYAKKILNKWSEANKAIDFLHEVETTKFHENINEYSFIKALDVLKIWSSTLKSLNRTFPLKAGIFDYVIFDEASQIDLPSAAPALYRAKNAVVVGDPMQLPHIVGITKDLDKEIAKTYGLYDHKDLYPLKIMYYNVSLYRCAESFSDKSPVLLAKHYRSEDQIINLCNRVFYDNRLTISSNLNYSNWPNSLPLGIQWEDCKGTVIKPSSGGSRINKDEALKINEVFQDILKKINNTKLTVGIVTPYNRQVKQIRQIISQTTSQEILEKHDVKILTAHQFQGSEKDIMIFSVVLSSSGNGNSDYWYNEQEQILNVALSRAKYLLYIVGDKQFCLQRNGVLEKIAENYEKIKKEEEFEKQYFSGNLETPSELYLYSDLQKIDFKSIGYKLIPKFIEKRYTLDFALIGKDKKIDIECDGFGTHNIIDGLPVVEDAERDEYLEKRSWIILRFPNYKIFNNIDKVINKILDTCKNRNANK
ncbi:AAA family ATPase [Candidatus Parcubacteria bacterium]|nr:AAA family ATPase [Candidatus Parcubacteria bacterium]